MTRLRTVVKDDSAVNMEKLRSADDVMGIVHDRERSYEIVVGPGKSRKYADQCREMGITAGSDGSVKTNPDWKTNKEKLRAGRKENRLKSVLKLVGDIFVPLIPGIITAGLCAGFAALIAQTVPDYAGSKAWSIIYNLLTLVNVSFMTYMTAWTGYRAAERFGGTPIIGGMLGMISSLEGINQISLLLGLYNEQAPLSSILRAGKGGVLAVIFGAFVLSAAEKKIRSRMPESVDVIFTPLLSLLACMIPYILIIMPVLGYVSEGIVRIFSLLCMSGNVFVRILTGYVSAALFLPFVAAGMHHGLVALYSVQLQELGYVTLYPALAMAGAGQVGAAIALWIKAERAGNRKMCSRIMGALPAGFLGIGEPLIYGVTLPLGRPFITAGLGAGFGGALVMAFEVASTTWGPSGLLGMFVMTAGPLGAVKSSMIYLAGLAVSYLCSFIITAVACSEQELMPENTEPAGPIPLPDLPDDAAPAGQSTLHRTVRHGDMIPLGGSDTRPEKTVAAPSDGKLIPMEEIPDPVFSSGTLGDCVGVIPDNGTVYAPCSGVVTGVAETKHAVTFLASDGREILVHAGIDTVKLNGRGFTVCVAAGTAVSQGDKILEADLDVIREAGFSTVIITAVP